MKKVNLELSSEQYKELIKLVYIGDWVIDEPENIVLNDLVQVVFSKAKDAGHESLIEFDKEMNLYMPSQAFDDEVVEIVDDYEEECFWDHLIYRMSEKDLEAKLGDKAEKLTNEERIDMIDPISEKYVKEFEENGIDNLVIK
jgi:hypothetical protein